MKLGFLYYELGLYILERYKLIYAEIREYCLSRGEKYVSILLVNLIIHFLTAYGITLM